MSALPGTPRRGARQRLSRKPLPPHARELADARARGLTLKRGYVALAFGWRRPTNGYGVTVPADRDPAVFDWSWARGLDVLLWRRGEPVERVRAVVTALRLAAPRRVIVVDVLDGGRGGRILNVIDTTRRTA